MKYACTPSKDDLCFSRGYGNPPLRCLVSMISKSEHLDFRKRAPKKNSATKFRSENPKSEHLDFRKRAHMFIPPHMKKRRVYKCAMCRWCAKKCDMKHMYKLRDGPIDWWFCDDDHALEWLDYRHSTPSIHAMLKTCPSQRRLGGKHISEWVRDELSHA